MMASDNSETSAMTAEGPMRMASEVSSSGSGCGGASTEKLLDSMVRANRSDG
ncbi:unknown [Collinsella sp. CAG:398]|nr:unknown [Collinsella sp. CAG:398]